MASKELKPLYMASSMEELNKKMNTNIEYSTPRLLGRSSNKLFLAARDAALEGDEEKSYVFYMRFLDLVKKIRASKDYKSKKVEFDKLIPSHKIMVALDEAEKLSESLRERYTEPHGKRPKLESSEEPIADGGRGQSSEGGGTSESPNYPVSAEDVYRKNLSSSLLPPQSSSESTCTNTSSSSAFSSSNSPSLSPEELFSLLKSSPDNVLVLDCRPRSMFLASHPDAKKLPQWLSVPEEMTKQGITTDAISKFLSGSGKRQWREREKKAAIVLVDASSSLSQLQEETAQSLPIVQLRDAIYKFDTSVQLPRPPVYLDGGYTQWYLHYFPMCVGVWKGEDRRKEEETKEEKEEEGRKGEVDYPSFPEFSDPISTAKETTPPQPDQTTPACPTLPCSVDDMASVPSNGHPPSSPSLPPHPPLSPQQQHPSQIVPVSSPPSTSHTLTPHTPTPHTITPHTVYNPPPVMTILSLDDPNLNSDDIEIPPPRPPENWSIPYDHIAPQLQNGQIHQQVGPSHLQPANSLPHPSQFSGAPQHYPGQPHFFSPPGQFEQPTVNGLDAQFANNAAQATGEGYGPIMNDHTRQPGNQMGPSQMVPHILTGQQQVFSHEQTGHQIAHGPQMGQQVISGTQMVQQAVSNPQMGQQNLQAGQQGPQMVQQAVSNPQMGQQNLQAGQQGPQMMQQAVSNPQMGQQMMTNSQVGQLHSHVIPPSQTLQDRQFSTHPQMGHQLGTHHTSQTQQLYSPQTEQHAAPSHLHMVHSTVQNVPHPQHTGQLMPSHPQTAQLRTLSHTQAVEPSANPRSVYGPIPNPPNYDQALSLPSHPPLQPPVPPPVSLLNTNRPDPHQGLLDHHRHLVQPVHQLPPSQPHQPAPTLNPNPESVARIHDLEERLRRATDAGREGERARHEQAEHERAALEREKMKMREERERMAAQLLWEKESVEAERARLEGEKVRLSRTVAEERQQFHALKLQFEEEKTKAAKESERLRQLLAMRVGAQDGQRAFAVTRGLPAGWEKRLDRTTGRFYYVDHNNHTTHWNPPANWMAYQAQAQQMREQDRIKGAGKIATQQPPPQGPGAIQRVPASRGQASPLLSVGGQEQIPAQPPIQPAQKFQPPSRVPAKPSPVATPQAARAKSPPQIQTGQSPEPRPTPTVDRTKKPQAPSAKVATPSVDRSSKPIMSMAVYNKKMSNLQGVFGSQGRTLTGLRNLGNTCFMNCILQCLSASTPLSTHFIQGTFHKDINRSNPLGCRGVLAEEFWFLIKALWSGQYRYVYPRDFKDAIGHFAPTFSGNQQQDSQEFLAFLMDGIHEDMNRVTHKQYIEEPSYSGLGDREAAKLSWNLHRKRNDSVVVDLFQGQFMSSLRCLTCKHRSVTFEVFMYLSVPLPPGNKPCTLQQCIKLFTKEERVSGSNKWFCPVCRAHRDAMKRIQIWKLPPVLLIHIKRFSYEGVWRQKKQNFVDFPFRGLDMSSDVVGDTDGLRKYDLYAVSNHFGTLSGGHYTAFCLHPYNRKFYCFDDHEVNEVNLQRVKSAAAYVLFYTSMDQVPPKIF